MKQLEIDSYFFFFFSLDGEAKPSFSKNQATNRSDLFYFFAVHILVKESKAAIYSQMDPIWMIDRKRFIRWLLSRSFGSNYIVDRIDAQRDS